MWLMDRLQIIKRDKRILAGADTLITSVKDIVLASDGKLLYILNKNNNNYEILFFNPSRNGNVRPGVIKLPNITQVRKTFLSKDNKTIFILSNHDILSVSAISNSRSNLEEKKPKLLNMVSSSRLDQVTHIESNSREFMILYPSLCILL